VYISSETAALEAVQVPVEEGEEKVMVRYSKSDLVKLLVMAAVIACAMVTLVRGIRSILQSRDAARSKISQKHPRFGCTDDVINAIEGLEDVANQLMDVCQRTQQQAAAFVGSETDADMQWSGNAMKNELLWLKDKINNAKEECLLDSLEWDSLLK